MTACRDLILSGQYYIIHQEFRMLRNLGMLRSRIRNLDKGRVSRSPCRATRREFFISVPLATFGSNLIEQQPQIGNCPTCETR